MYLKAFASELPTGVYRRWDLTGDHLDPLQQLFTRKSCSKYREKEIAFVEYQAHKYNQRFEHKLNTQYMKTLRWQDASYELDGYNSNLKIAVAFNG